MYKVKNIFAWKLKKIGRGLCHVAHDGAQGVQQLRLHPRLQDHQIHVDLLGVLELPQNPVVVPLSNALRVAACRLYERFQRSFQELVYLAVVVIVVPGKSNAR